MCKILNGIVYDRKNDSFRTIKVNTIFSRIAHLSGNTPENEKGTNHTDDDLSLLAEKEGFEPPDLLQSTVFKTAAIDRSAISPLQKYKTDRTFKKNLFKLHIHLFKILCQIGFAREKKLFLGITDTHYGP